MTLKVEINDLIRKIESVNIELEDVGGDSEHYQYCLNCLGEAVDQLYGVVYYLEKHE